MEKILERYKSEAKEEERGKDFAKSNPEFMKSLKKSPYYNKTQEEIGKVYADEPNDTVEQDEFGISRRF